MVERRNYYFEEHIDNMDQAWKDYTQYCTSLGIKPLEPVFAFSFLSKKIIRARDNNQCQNHDDCPFEEDYTEVAHWVEGSDNPKHGRVSCRPTHYLDHSMEISEHSNHRASARLVWSRMPEHEKDWVRRKFPDQAYD